MRLGSGWGARSNIAIDPRVDLRANVKRTALNKWRNDPDSDLWELPFDANTKLEPYREWWYERGANFDLFTKGQQMVILAGNADAEIQNGGVAQLFFNRAASVPRMEKALREIGCSSAEAILTAELNRLSLTNYIEKWVAAREEFSNADSKEVAWDAFLEINNHFFGEESEVTDDAWYALRDDLYECTKSYILSHEDEFFIIAED